MIERIVSRAGLTAVIGPNIVVEAGIGMIIDYCYLVVNAACSATIVQEVLRDQIVRNTGD